MTIQTVPQDVYQRHEREWQMLREAIAKAKKQADKPAFTIPSDPYLNSSKDRPQ
ncbi:hypothetical protein [Phyllobacterium endophyticum]|jgi:hypothetical protein|uniref:hypothetical protein n=1 Tax=Phyllobacterium endophyticum TaxID=1149773 RepID=UPI00147547BF|nr:hypothetical protein [Phyllobacterium endophyticum]MBB3238193.1 hypothetical protein [Phyllobacterium endophyticum]